MTVEELVASVLDVAPSIITEETGPATLQAWTSLKHLELLETLQAVYGFTLTTREIHRLTCVADIHRILRQKQIATP